MWTRRLVRSPAQVRDGLKRQVTAPVRWEQAMRVLRAEQVECFIEVGPGKVLSGLLRQIDSSLECLRVEDMAYAERSAGVGRRRSMRGCQISRLDRGGRGR